MEKVLITGATGFIGYELTNQLLDRGLKPRILVRRPLRGALFARTEAEIVQGDLLRKESLRRAVEGVDTVFHLGARATFEKYSVVKDSIVDGSADLMRCAIDAGVSRFVHASSLLVYDDQENEIDRETPAEPSSGYGKAKKEAEEKLVELSGTGGIDFAAVRLPHVYGARDLMFKEVRKGRAMFPGLGKNLYAHLHIRDAARVMIRIAETGWTGVSPVADDMPASWKTFFDVIRQYYPRFRTIRVPEALSILGTGLMAPARWLGRRPTIYTPDAVRTWNDSLPVKSGVLWDDLGIEPEFPTIHQGIPAVMDECVAFQWIHPIDDKIG